MGKTILTVDDSALVRRQMRIILEDEGYTVFEAATGKQGIELVERGDVDLVIADQHMPEMTGLQMLEKLRTDGHRTPVVFLTTEASASMVEAGRRHQASAWMVKPMKPALLLKAIAKLTQS